VERLDAVVEKENVTIEDLTKRVEKLGSYL